MRAPKQIEGQMALDASIAPGRLPPPPDVAYREQEGLEKTLRQRAAHERMTACSCPRDVQMVINPATGELVEQRDAKGRIVLHHPGCPRAK